MIDYAIIDAERRVLSIERRDDAIPPPDSAVVITSLPDWVANECKTLRVTLEGTFEWIDERTLDQAKTDQWSKVKAARDAAEFGGFAWDGSTFDSDVVSQSRIQGASQLATLAALASEPFSVDWTLADNTVRTLSGADMLAAGQAMGVHIMTVHETGRTLRAAIEAATTIAEVESIDWPV